MLSITCPVETVPLQVFESLQRAIRINREYKPTPVLEDQLRAINPHAPTLWQSLMKDKVIKSFKRMARKQHKLVSDYAKRDITTIAHENDFAPMNLLRFILTQSYPAETIARVFNENQTSLLYKRDRKQFALAQASDITHIDVLKQSLDNEAAWIRAFTSKHNLPHRVQDDLVAEQKAAYGRAVATPDILLTQPIEINGHIVHWIDYKDYVGGPIDFLAESNAKQCARYVTMWGPGALVYHACVEGWSLPNVVMLSRCLDATDL